jgi:hypothetical protein
MGVTLRKYLFDSGIGNGSIIEQVPSPDNDGINVGSGKLPHA